MPYPAAAPACFPDQPIAYCSNSLHIRKIPMQTHVITSLVVLAAVIATAVIMLLYFPVALVWTTYEDLYGEWAQWYLFVVTGLFAVRLAFSKIPHRVFFGLLAIACLYVVGEEISWGQRLLDFASPDFFR